MAKVEGEELNIVRFKIKEKGNSSVEKLLKMHKTSIVMINFCICQLLMLFGRGVSGMLTVLEITKLTLFSPVM